MSTLLKLINSLNKAGFNAAMVALVIMMLMVTTETILRTFFKVSIMVADEFAGYFSVCLVFLGIGYCVTNKALIRVDIIYRRLGNFNQKLLKMIFDLFSLVISVILCYEFGRLCLHSFQAKVVSNSLAEVPLWIPQVVMPIGTGILIMSLLLEIWQNTMDFLKSGKEDRNSGKMESDKDRTLP